ncbi:MAG: aldehyde-activating protein [Rhodomicrobium sp.]|nr:MAG: aldehyde-activating protein [Rhodomicrobium sp.]
MIKYKGSCHCGAVTFEVEAAEAVEVEDCNCSICTKTGFLHLIVPKSDFTLLTGQEELTTYSFNTGVAKHSFCSHCGIKSFYTPRSNPDGVDVNLRCLDTAPKSVKLVPFDGRNWEENAHRVAHKSKPNTKT